MTISAINAVRTATRQTVEAGTARILYTRDLSSTQPRRAARDSKGGLRGLVGTAAKDAGEMIGTGLLRLVIGRTDFWRQTAEGVLDFSGRRSMIDFGSSGSIQVGDQQWVGHSGRVLATPSQPCKLR